MFESESWKARDAGDLVLTTMANRLHPVCSIPVNRLHPREGIRDRFPVLGSFSGFSTLTGASWPPGVEAGKAWFISGAGSPKSAMVSTGAREMMSHPTQSAEDISYSLLPAI